MTRKSIFWFVVLLLAIDQAVKLWVRTNMYLGEEFVVFDWFRIHFIENRGAAWGMELGGGAAWGKLALSLLRVVLSGVLIWYIGRLAKKHAPTGVLIGFGLILAGAMGNIFDSAFYGMIFGYAGFLHGRVVDMFYFPILYNNAGEVVFFNAIFNVADAYISVGAIYLLLFQRKYFK